MLKTKVRYKPYLQIKICILISLYFSAFPTNALEVNAFLNKQTISIDESFVLTIKLQTNKGQIKNIQTPDVSAYLDNFHLLNSWQGQESSVQIINGNVTKTSSILQNYRLQAKKIGDLTIKPLKITANGKQFKTNSLKITVTKIKVPSAKSSPPLLRNLPFSIPTPFSSPNIKSLIDPFLKDITPKTGNLKLKVQTSANTIYKTQKLRVDWFVLQSSLSIHYEAYKYPDLKGFWKEQTTPQKIDKGTQVINNVLYKKTLLDSTWLFPLQTGELTIDPYSIRLRHFFSHQDLRFSPAKKITVKDLPSQGRDNSFTGAVGVFTVTSSLKDQEGAVGQPLSYKITFNGSGHPRFINLPELVFPDNVQTYPPTEKSNFSSDGKGTKEFEFLIIPKTQGRLHIPSFTLSSFNPLKKQYIFHQTKEFFIPVKKGDANSKEEGTSFFEVKNEKKPTLSFEPLKKTYWPQFITYKNLIWFYLTLFTCFPIYLIFYS